MNHLHLENKQNKERCRRVRKNYLTFWFLDANFLCELSLMNRKDIMRNVAEIGALIVLDEARFSVYIGKKQNLIPLSVMGNVSEALILVLFVCGV